MEKLTAAWAGRGGMLAVLAPIINTAYLGTVDTDEDAERAGLGSRWRTDGSRTVSPWRGPSGWVTPRCRRRRAASLQTRARALLTRARVLAVMNVALMAAGVLALVAIWRRRRRPGALAVGRAALPPPWPGKLGVVVLIRGGAGAALVVVALLFVSGLSAPGSISTTR